MLGVRVDKIIPLSQGKHTKIEFSYGSYRGQALIFSLAPEKLVSQLAISLICSWSLE